MTSERAPLSGLRWMLVPAAIGVASRVFSVGVILIENVMQHGVPNPLTSWDGGWYLGIVSNGYHAAVLQNGHHDFAFFPAWPILIKLLTLGFLPADVMATLAANVLFVIAIILVWRVLADRFSPGTATRSIALLAFAPPAYVFSMAYAESLFLAAAAGSLVSTRAPVRGVLAALASMTRLTGLAIAAGSAGAAIASSAQGKRRLFLAAAAGSVIGFGLWFAYVAVLTGDPLGYFQGSSSWIHGHVLRTQLRVIRRHELMFAAKFAFVALVFVGALLSVRRDRELGIFALAAVAIAIASMAAVPVNSIARYALSAFPAFAGISERLNRIGMAVLLLAFAVGQIFFASWTVGIDRLPP